MQSIFNKQEIEKECEEFYSLYNVTKGRTRDMCQSKLDHIRAVAANCYHFARHEGFDEYDIDLAWIIGELHDFARFGQIVATSSYFSGSEFNHARLGARLLFTHGMITDLIKNYDEVCETDRLVMEKAVYHHSDFRLPDDLTERERLFCEVIRQADRADIFRSNAVSGWETVYGHTKEEVLSTDISDAVYESFMKQEMLNYSQLRTLADQHLAGIALCFGLTFPSARKRVLKLGYLPKLLDVTFLNSDVQEKYLKMRAKVEDYLYK